MRNASAKVIPNEVFHLNIATPFAKEKTGTWDN